jgi:hypothetical protein
MDRIHPRKWEKTDIRTEAVFHLLFQSSSLTQGLAQRMIAR